MLARICVAVLLCLFYTSTGADADTRTAAVFSPSGKITNALLSAFEKGTTKGRTFHYDASAPKPFDLAILVGEKQFRAYCSSDHTQPALVVFTYKSVYESVKDSCSMPTSAVFADAPIEKQQRLARLLFPTQKSMRLGQDEVVEENLLSVKPVGTSAYETLGLALEETGWKSLLLTIDGDLYKKGDYRPILETLYRYRKSAIAPNQALFRAGATAGVFYTTEDLINASVDALERYYADGLPLSHYPDEARVELNSPLLRSVFGIVVTPSEIAMYTEAVND